MRRVEWKAATLITSLAFTACGDSNEPGVEADGGMDAGTDAQAHGELTAVTYNLGLLDTVGFVSERAPLAIEAAAALDADLLCVQEVWEQAHWDALVDADTTRPHALRLAPEPGAMGQCSPDEFNPLQACAEPACGGSTELVACVIGMCATDVGGLSAGCQGCLLGAAASTSDFAAIRATCVGSSDSTDDLDERSYVSGGSYGTGLLSAIPFAETDERRLDASTVRRAILYARLDDTPLGTVHVFCTHLTAILSGLQYEGSYAGWEAENAAHVEALIEWVDEKTDADDKVLVLGDLNTGPSGADITASVPENYAAFEAAGFENAFLRGSDAACTFCTSNPLVAAEDTGAGAAIDHVLTRGIEGSVSVERVLDELVTIDVMGAAQDGGTGALEEREVGLSDHFGLRATLSADADTGVAQR